MPQERWLRLQTWQKCSYRGTSIYIIDTGGESPVWQALHHKAAQELPLPPKDPGAPQQAFLQGVGLFWILKVNQDWQNRTVLEEWSWCLDRSQNISTNFLSCWSSVLPKRRAASCFGTLCCSFLTTPYKLFAHRMSWRHVQAGILHTPCWDSRACQIQSRCQFKNAFLSAKWV